MSSLRERSLGLRTVDELFMTGEERADEKREKVTDISLSEIDDFPDHPFRVVNDEAMLEMVESIKQQGVLVPAIARKKEDGRYELISGHRRKMAYRSDFFSYLTTPTSNNQCSKWTQFIRKSIYICSSQLPHPVKL